MVIQLTDMQAHCVDGNAKRTVIPVIVTWNPT